MKRNPTMQWPMTIGIIIDLCTHLVEDILILLGSLRGTLWVCHQLLKVVGQEMVCTVALPCLHILHHEV